MATDNTETVETTNTEETVSATEPRTRSWRPGSIILGLFLIGFGILLFLENTDVVQLSLDRIWQLWPLIIIAVGLSMMSIRGWLGTLLMVTFLAGAIGLVGLVAIGGLKPGGPVPALTTKTVEIAGQSDKSKDASISIKDGAGTIRIDSVDMPQFVKASLESNIMKLSQTSRTENDRQSVEIVVGNAEGRWWNGNFRNDLSVTLTRSTPLRLSLDAGASTIDADLSEVKLRQLKLDSGASKIDVKLGDKSDETDIDLDAGMSTIKLLVPKTSGVRLDIDSPMSSLDIPELTRISDDVYESSNFESSPNKIQIKSHVGMGTFAIEYY